MITSCLFFPPGASPVQRCLVAGDDETGITVCGLWRTAVSSGQIGWAVVALDSMKLLQQLHRFVLFDFSFGLPKPIQNKHETWRVLSRNNQLRPLKMTACAFPWVLYSILVSRILDKLGGPYYDRNIWSYRAPINGIIYTGFTGVPNEAVISVAFVVSPYPKMLQWYDIFYLHEWLYHVGKEFQSHPVPYGLPIGLAPSLVASDPLYCGQDGCRVRNPRISAVGLALKEKATDSNPKILGLAPKPTCFGGF